MCKASIYIIGMEREPKQTKTQRETHRERQKERQTDRQRQSARSLDNACVKHQ